MTLRVPQGFRLAGVYSGVKRDPSKLDLTLVVSDRPAVAAGVYTKNLVHAAPVALDRCRTPSDRIRAVVINSGNANACTGEQGLKDAKEMTRLAAAACGAKEDEALVLSTGVIGSYLPLDKIAGGIQAAAAQLGTDEDAILTAARGMLTTDTFHKVACKTLVVDNQEITIFGMAKGAAMMGPNMATMLALIITDAKLDKQTAQETLTSAVNETFNCISVEGHMSTNDSVLLVANGAAGGRPLSGANLKAFYHEFLGVCEELARAIPNDGEGCTHLITLELAGCADRASAMQLAKTVANSPLVKTAIHGADPNWGRIVSAAGYAEVPFAPAGVTLHVNGYLLYENGAPVEFDAKEVSASIRNNRDTSIKLQFSEGNAGIRFWTSDLTAEYVHLNADYHT
jgi:glutamate N-acetyltransferase/amino-acid N-acetyltransferase